MEQIANNAQVLDDTNLVKTIMTVVESNFSPKKDSLNQLRTLLEEIATQT